MTALMQAAPSFRYDLLIDAGIAPPTEPVIPKILHYVWVGLSPVPDKVRRLVDGWHSLNPDYEIILWNEDNIDFSFKFLQAAYGMQAWNRVSDFTRMWALLRHGGIYLDTDIELRRPLDDLRRNRCFMGFQTPERHVDWVNGAVIGAAPNHWFIERLHTHFVEQMGGWEEVGSFYGPGLITRLLVEEGLREYADTPQRVDDITLYPTRWFYPYAWKEQFSEDRVTPDTYAIHHWDETWLKRRGLGQRCLRLGLRTLARTSPSLSYHGMRSYVQHKKRQAPMGA